MNKTARKKIGWKLYITILSMLISFFTIYAYRYVVLNLLYESGKVDFQISESKKEEIIHELENIEIVNDNLEKIHDILHTNLMNYEFSVYGNLNGRGDVYFISSRGTAPYKQSSLYSSSFHVELTRKRGKLNITIYPKFTKFIDYYTMFSAICSFLLGLLLFKAIAAEQKNRRLQNHLKSIWNAKALRVFHKLSIELLLINILAAFISLGVFLFVYINRYSYIEFIRDHISFEHALDAYAKQMQKELRSFQLNKSDKEQINLLLRNDIIQDAEPYIYHENGEYYTGGNIRDITDSRIYNDVGVLALTTPYLYYFPLQTNEETAILLIYHYPLIQYMSWYMIIIIIFAFSIYIMILMNFIRLKVRAIQILQQDVAALSLGDWNHEITEMPDDEIGQLGEELKSMQKSFYENMENENAAKKANQELVTTLSHDLRTPLTSLLGYLELVRYREGTEEQKQNYLDRSLQKVEQIRNLSDKLFEYFLISERVENIELQEQPLELWLSYIQDNAEFMIQDGLNIQLNLDFSLNYKAVYNMEMLQRATDNVFSNIHKYANREDLIIIKGEALEQFYKVQMINTVSTDKEGVNSTKIGLKSVDKIMVLHHGLLNITKDRNRFSIELLLPLLKKE